MAMTREELMMMLAPTLASAASGVLQNRQNNLTNQMNQRNFGLSQAGDVEQQLMQNRMTRSQAALGASPLGAEQQYVQKMKMMQALLPALSQFQSARPTDAGILSTFRPSSNILQQFASNPGLQQSFGDNPTAAALAERRKMIAQVNPDVQFGSLGDYGLPSERDTDIESARSTAFAEQKASEAAQRDYAQQALNAQQQQQQPEKKKGGFLSKLGTVIKVAAPIVLAATGVGAPAAAAWMAAANVAGSKMQGQSWGNSLKSGAVGAATGAVGAGALGTGTRAGMSAATQKAAAMGALSALDTKTSGGSWNDALASGMQGAAVSKVGDMARNKFQGSAGGLNNKMTPQSLPLGSGYSGANNPGTGLQNVMKNSPQLLLQSKQLQGAQQYPQAPPTNTPQYPMENKVKMAVTGMMEPRMVPSHGPQPMASPPPPQTGNWVSQLFGLDRLPGMIQNGSPYSLGGDLMGAAGVMAGPARQAYMAGRVPPNAQQNVQNIMTAMAKNGGQDNAALNIAAQPYYNAVPGNITQSMTPEQLQQFLLRQQKLRQTIMGR